MTQGSRWVLVDFHPKPDEALCDGPQALLMNELEVFVRDAELVRKTYLERVKLGERLGARHA